jgi:hypothetical protein
MNDNVKNRTTTPVFPERIVRTFYSLFSEKKKEAENRSPCKKKVYDLGESKEDNSDKHVPIKSLKSRTGARSPQ